MGKKTTKTSEQQHAVTQPNVPDWIGGPYKDYMSRIQQFAGMDPSQFVPGASDIQRQAFGMTQGLTDRLGKRGFAIPQWPAASPRPAPQAPAPVAPQAPQTAPVMPAPNFYQGYTNDPRVQQNVDLLAANGGLPDWYKF